MRPASGQGLTAVTSIPTSRNTREFTANAAYSQKEETAMRVLADMPVRMP